MSTTVPPPAEDLKTTLVENDALYQESDSDIEAAVDRSPLSQPIQDEIESPTRVTATLRNGKDASPKRDDRSSTVGWIGFDEFYISRGVKETFEGGHVIPHALFDADDEAADKAGAYENLVPMSRFVNIGTWGNKETQIKGKLTELAASEDTEDDKLVITVPIGAGTYTILASVLGNRFGLTFIGEQDEELVLNEWIPTTIGPVDVKHVTSEDMDVSEAEYSQAEDNPLRTRAEVITTGEELADAIERSGLNVHPDLLELVRTCDK